MRHPWHLTHFLVSLEARGNGREHTLFPCFFKITYLNSRVLSHWDSRISVLKNGRKAGAFLITQ